MTASERKPPERAPFTADGSLVHKGSAAHAWKDVAPFHAELRLDAVSRNKSESSHFVLRDLSGATFPMFPTDLVDLLLHSVMSNGLVEGWWVVTRRGPCYGLRRSERSGAVS